MSPRLERDYQRNLIKTLRELFPGCFILKNDPNYMQGVPDLIVLYKNKWAMLEVKISETSPIQPNQEYYVDLLNHSGFAAFIYPENEEEVLHDLQLAFQPRRSTRVSQR